MSGLFYIGMTKLRVLSLLPSVVKPLRSVQSGAFAQRRIFKFEWTDYSLRS